MSTQVTLSDAQVDALRWALGIAIDLDEVEDDETRGDLQAILDAIGG